MWDTIGLVITHHIMLEGGEEGVAGDGMAVPKTKDNIVSLYLDRCSLAHKGICNVNELFALLVQETKCCC